eukprot:10116578-Ditylum_brightwellii.AAC.1
MFWRKTSVARAGLNVMCFASHSGGGMRCWFGEWVTHGFQKGLDMSNDPNGRHRSATVMFRMTAMHATTMRPCRQWDAVPKVGIVAHQLHQDQFVHRSVWMMCEEVFQFFDWLELGNIGDGGVLLGVDVGLNVILELLENRSVVGKLSPVASSASDDGGGMMCVSEGQVCSGLHGVVAGSDDGGAAVSNGLVLGRGMGLVCGVANGVGVGMTRGSKQWAGAGVCP